jgi:hypothetical protein
MIDGQKLFETLRVGVPPTALSMDDHKTSEAIRRKCVACR